MTRAGWSLAVFAVGFVFLQGLQAYDRPYAYRGTYFQEASSEDMMQTVSLLDLRERPLQTLLVLHVQPPLLDAVRALLARLWPELPRRKLVVRVDRSLYLLWSLVYAGMGVLVFRWLQLLVASTRIAVLGALGFFLHPAAIFYATFLEGTLLTSLGVLWLCYALWRFPARGSTLSLVAAYLFLFFVRSIFQWPALLVVVAALVLRRAPRRKVLVFAVSSAVVVGAFMLKQYLVFGSTSTSSFAGMSCLQSLGEEPEVGSSSDAATPMGPLYPKLAAGGDPPALTRRIKITGAHNFNGLADLREERELLRRCVARLTSQPLGTTLRAWAENLTIFFQPSSRYLTAHVIVDRLPWRGAFDWLFSGLRLVFLLAAGALLWAWGRTRSEILAGLGLALPVVFVSAVCVVFERGENMRFKFFVEPVLYVFLVAQAVAAVRRLRSRHASAGAAPLSGRTPRFEI
jgi:hypothetical protein